MAKKDWMIKESELDDDQLRVLTAILDRSLIAKGCAGSGKSVLALIKAQRIQREKGNDYQIIVFTKALCNYMNAGRKALGLNKDFDYHWEWKNRKHCPSSDYIIVDEIQDFEQTEIQEFIKAARKNFFFFGDTAQSIYDGLKNTMSVENIRDVLSPAEKSKVREMELYRNYRLPVPVARLVQHVGVDLEVYDEQIYKSKEIAMPRFIRCASALEQVKTIVDVIKKQSLSDVGILLPHNEDVINVSNLLNQNSCNHELRYTDQKNWRLSRDTLNFSTDNPKVMTYHSAKGLQFETVFLPYVDTLPSMPKKSEQKALYVAMTRTYKNLFVLYSGYLPSFLSNIPTELYKTSLVDEIEDI
ncbi:MAG: ATP-binding domain-containing protein [Bacteroidales bacterium]|nr:ATP-binding domain-containing protein [Bacteroidales bacterium]